MAAHFFPDLWQRSFAALYLLLFLLAGVAFIGKRSFFEHPVTWGALVFLVLAYFGGLVYKLDEDRRWSSHYTNHDAVAAFTGEVMETPRRTSSGWRFIAEVHEVIVDDSLERASGRVLVYVRDTGKVPRLGDVFYASGTPRPFRSPGNPGQFDFGEYMERQYVYQQVFLEGTSFMLQGRNEASWIRRLSDQIRSDLLLDIEGYFEDSGAIQIGQALLLGVKEDLDDGLRSAYATAGASHVLAVSGLHVGIVYLLLVGSLGRLRKYKHGNLLFVTAVVLIMWLYAFITGLSPSVFRSATMFTILAIGEAAGQDRNTYNTLGISAIFLLLVRPAFLFDLGFQFSYLAVFGIVYLFPRIHRLFHSDNWIVSQVWNVSCVSIAAQVSVAPLSIFYFHQFPTYFLLSNLVVVIFAFLILVMGLPMLVLGSIIPFLGIIIAVPLELLIIALNELITGIESLPGSAVRGIWMSTLTVVLVYGVIGSFLWSLEYRRFGAFLLTVILLGGFFAHGYAAEWKKNQRTAIVIYDVRGSFAMDLQSNGKASLMGEGLTREVIERSIDPARLTWRYECASRSEKPVNAKWSCDSLYCTTNWVGQRVLRIQHDLDNWQITDSLATDVLIISNNAKITEDQWRKLPSKHVVFDGTNDYWYVQRQRLALARFEIPSHFVSMDGFWQLNLSQTRLEP